MKEKVNNQVLFDQVRHGSFIELMTEMILLLPIMTIAARLSTMQFVVHSRTMTR